MNIIIERFLDENRKAKEEKKGKINQRKALFLSRINASVNVLILGSMPELGIFLQYNELNDTMDFYLKGKQTEHFIAEVNSGYEWHFALCVGESEHILNSENLLMRLWQILGLSVGKVEEQDLLEIYQNQK